MIYEFNDLVRQYPRAGNEIFTEINKEIYAAYSKWKQGDAKEITVELVIHEDGNPVTYHKWTHLHTLNKVKLKNTQ